MTHDNEWVAPLLAWYGKRRRTMPWRRKQPVPYAVWISEIMLQQTQVATVTPYYLRFIERFPDVRALAEADLQAVLKLWQGLGYYARARNMHKAAQRVVEAHDGHFPKTLEGLRSLPGIGEYTAAAVASICFGVAAPVVDGNVARVFARAFGIRREARDPRLRRQIRERLQAVIPSRTPGDFNQAIMELGALVCRPAEPDCGDCPLQAACVAFKRGQTDQYPRRTLTRKVPHYDVVACVIRRGDKVLISRRRADKMLGGLWEFPGGKAQPGETLEDAAHREIREELDIRIRVGAELCTLRHAYSHFAITLHAMDCRHVSGRARPLASDEIRWVSVSELHHLPFPAADVRILELITQREP